jgi:hypothetical protein
MHERVKLQMKTLLQESIKMINCKYLSFCYNCLGIRKNSPTPLSTVVLEKLIIAQLVKIYSALYEIPRLFITVFTTVRHLSQS